MFKFFQTLFPRWREKEAPLLGEEAAVVTPQNFPEMRPLGPMAKKKEKSFLGVVMSWVFENWLLIFVLVGSFYVIFVDTNWNWVVGLR